MQIGFLLASLSFMVALFSTYANIGGASVPIDGFWWGSLLLFVAIQLLQGATRKKESKISAGLLVTQALTLALLIADAVSLTQIPAWAKYALLDFCWVLAAARTWFFFVGLAEFDQILGQNNTPALLINRNHAVFITVLVLIFAALLPLMSVLGEAIYYGYQVSYLMWAAYQAFILTRIQRYYLPKPPEE
ncbi:MAG: hypothetical protein ACI4PQ_02465 [Butyricicoccaceae bacterium]